MARCISLKNQKIKIFQTRNPEIVKELVAELRRVENKFDADMRSDEESVEKQIEWMKRKLQSESTFLFVAIRENEKRNVIAYVFGWIEKRNKNYWKLTRFGYVGELFVKEEFRGMGVGRALLEKAEKWFAERGITKIFLDVEAENPAVNFYKKLGYRELELRMVKEISYS